MAEGFQELVYQWWLASSPSRCNAFVIAKMLSLLRGNLRKWVKFSFGSIKHCKLALLHELEKVDIIKESRGLSSTKLQ